MKKLLIFLLLVVGCDEAPIITPAYLMGLSKAGEIRRIKHNKEAKKTVRNRGTKKRKRGY